MNPLVLFMSDLNTSCIQHMTLLEWSS